MLRDRISSNSGATLVLALVFFLLCAVAGSVILVAGSGAAGRLADLKTDQQGYYSVTSAAKVLKSEIGKEKFSSEGTAISTGVLHDAIVNGLGQANSQKSYTLEDCSLKCEIAGADEEKLDVVFNFEMNASKAITVTILKPGTKGYTNACVLRVQSSQEIDGSTRWPSEDVIISNNFN